jgi:hypothetical protein
LATFLKAISKVLSEFDPPKAFLANVGRGAMLLLEMADMLPKCPVRTECKLVECKNASPWTTNKIHKKPKKDLFHIPMMDRRVN